MAGQRPLAARTAESVRKVRGVAADVVMLNRLSKVSSRIKGCRLETHEIVAIVVLPRIFGDIHRLHHTAFIKLRPNSHIKTTVVFDNDTSRRARPPRQIHTPEHTFPTKPTRRLQWICPA